MKFIHKITMSATDRANLSRFREFLEHNQASDVLEVVRKKKAGVYYESTKTSFCPVLPYPQLNSLEEERNLITYVNDINGIIRKSALKKQFMQFSSSAEQKISGLISAGVSTLAKACTLQLFSRERLHVLVLGSSFGVSIERIAGIAPVSTVFSRDNAGSLLVKKKGGQYDKGLLAKTNNGIFIITDLRFERPGEVSPIAMAMDKGYVVVERNQYSGRFSANINVLAFAVPEGIRLFTKNIDILRRQIPFSKEHLHRFHLVFAIDKTKPAELRINAEDCDFLKGYISFCCQKKVQWDKKYEQMVENFISFIKNDEAHFIIDVTQKIAAGIKKMACARAALHLREDVSEEDVKEALKIARDSLYVIG